MKRENIAIFLVLPLLLLVGPVTAGAKAGDERKLTREMSALDKVAASTRGAQTVTASLARTFRITKDQVMGLRAKRLPFGEIAAVYAVADRMDGGVNTANVNKVTDLRQGNGSWVQITRVFDVDLGSVSRQVDRIGRDVRSRMAAEPAGGGGASRP